MTHTFAVVCDCQGTAPIDRETVATALDAETVVTTTSAARQTDQIRSEATESDADQAVVICGNRDVRSHLERALGEHGLDPCITRSPHLGATSGSASEVVAAAANAAIGTTQQAEADGSEAEFVPGPVVVVGAPATARELAVAFPVILVADGTDLVDARCAGIDVVRGRAVALERDATGYRVTVESRVTDGCTECGRCVQAYPDHTTSHPVDVGERVDADVCPVEAITDEPVAQPVYGQQVVWPEYDGEFADVPAVHTDRAGLLQAVDACMTAGRREPVTVDESACAVGLRGQAGCTACSDVCPADAIAIDVDGDGSVTVDSTRCTDCGACVAACPTSAMTSPRARSVTDLAAAVDAVAATMTRDVSRVQVPFRSTTDDDPFVVAFTTDAGVDYLTRVTRRDETPPVVPIPVVSVGHVPASVVLYTLARGAGVVLVHEPESQVSRPLAGARGTVDLLADTLTRGGLTANVQVVEGGDVAALENAIRTAHPGDREARPPADSAPSAESIADGADNQTVARTAVSALAGDAGPDPWPVPYAGTVRVEDSDCTNCPTCATLCPTDALTLGDGELTFDATSCVGCGICETGCPEDAVRVVDTVRPASWEGEETVLVQADQAECVECGVEFAPRRGLQTVQQTLTETGRFGDTELNLDRCPDCRRTGAGR